MSEYDYLFRVLLIGDSSTGKEELCSQHCSDYFMEDLKHTIGVDFFSKTINFNNKKAKLNIWDFGEEERFKFLLSQYCKSQDCVIIMYDIANSNTLNHLPEWTRIIRENVGDIPIILVGNKINLDKPRMVSRDESVEIAQKHKLFWHTEISTKTGENVEELFEFVIKCIFNH